MSIAFRRMYLLTQAPVEVGRPLQLGFVEKNKWSQSLFDKYALHAEESRVKGISRIFLTKRDIERWGFMPPCGPRVEVIEVELPNACEHQTQQELR